MSYLYFTAEKINQDLSLLWMFYLEDQATSIKLLKQGYRVCHVIIEIFFCEIL